MRTISNLEIAKRLCQIDKISAYFTFGEILRIVDMNRSIIEEVTPCDAEKVFEDFRSSFLEGIDLAEELSKA